MTIVDHLAPTADHQQSRCAPGPRSYVVQELLPSQDRLAIDAWIAHAGDAASWRPALLAYAHAYCGQVIADWTQFNLALQAASKTRTRQATKKTSAR